jgi:MSHA biogenesis protein MshK
MRLMNRLVLAWAGVLMSLAVRAEVLPDPTLPPAVMAAKLDAASEAVSAKPVLQSVILAPNRKLAIIDGVAVRLGDHFRDARVVRITENEVLLRGTNGTETLKLYQQIKKQSSLSEQPRPATAQGGESRK